MAQSAENPCRWEFLIQAHRRRWGLAELHFSFCAQILGGDVFILIGEGMWKRDKWNREGSIFLMFLLEEKKTPTDKFDSLKTGSEFNLLA